MTGLRAALGLAEIGLSVFLVEKERTWAAGWALSDPCILTAKTAESLWAGWYSM